MDNGGLPSSRIDLDDFALGEGMGVDFTATAVLSSMSRVVIERDNFFITVPRDKARVMLEAELDVGPKIEVGLDTTQAPDNLAGGAVDLVDCAGIASRDEIVTLGIFVDGVDVEVIPRIRRVVTGAGLARVNG